jgi:16S rRNA processing protein RimM
MADQRFIRLGGLTRAFGLDGGLRCRLDSELVPTIETPCDARVGFSENYTSPRRLVRYQDHSGTLICFFEGIGGEEEAKKLADQALFLPEEKITYPDTLAHPRLIGYRVRSEEGRDLGEIKTIFKTSAHHVWEIASATGEWMMPAIGEFLVELQHEQKTAIVRPIPGMVDQEGEEDDRPE